MTPQELLEAKLQLAEMRLALLKLAKGEKRVSVASGGESVTYSQGNAPLLDELAQRLENRIAVAEGRGRRPIHFI